METFDMLGGFMIMEGAWGICRVSGLLERVRAPDRRKSRLRVTLLIPQALRASGIAVLTQLTVVAEEVRWTG